MNQNLFPGRSFQAFLFDMDGTILSSIAAAERVWTDWGRRHGVDIEELLANIHGVRAEETVRRFAPPGSDFAMETASITRAEIEDVDGIEPIAGAPAFLASLPADRWAVVTSAPRALAERRLDAAGLPCPPLMITAEDVTRGKPEPDGFLRAAERLGVQASDCLVFEDAPAGVAAAEAAGAAVIVITATHAHPFATRHPSVPDFDDLAVEAGPSGGLSLCRRLKKKA